MFWKFNTPSAVQIEALLEKEDVTLEQLMEEEELLQECKGQNKKVVDFLTKPENLEKLVKMIVTEPLPTVDINLQFKNANSASELLTCDVTSITSTIASSSNLLQYLYEFLRKDKPLNPLLASFVSKVLGMLILRKSEQDWYSYQFTCFQVIDFLKSKGNFVSTVVHHVGTSAILDLILNLVDGVESDEKEIKLKIHEWLDECHLIESLVEKLSPECDSSEHASVDQILCEIVNTKWSDISFTDNSPITTSILLSRLESNEVVCKLLDMLLHPDRNNSSVFHVINVLLALLSTTHPKHSTCLQNEDKEVINFNIDNSQVISIILTRLEDIHSLLTNPSKSGIVPTAYGEEVERLGRIRLQTVTLLTSLIKNSYREVYEKFAQISILETIWELFFTFSLNNFLHAQVSQLIIYILKNPVREFKTVNPPEDMGQKELEKSEDPEESIASYNNPLLRQLFGPSEIIQKILDTYNDLSESTNAKTHNLRGYMGHLREIANTIVACTSNGPNSQYICQLIEDLPQDIQTNWEDFRTVDLAEINLRNKILPVQIQSVFLSDEESNDDITEHVCSKSLVFVNQDFSETRLEMEIRSAIVTSGIFNNIDDDMSCSERKMGLDQSNVVSTDFSEDDADYGLFSQMVAQRTMDEAANNEFWKWDKFKKSSGSKEFNSSSDEEDTEFDNLRSIDEKMEEDLINKADRIRNWNFTVDSSQSTNPWHMAPAEETTDNSWANFDAAPKSDNQFYVVPDANETFEVNFENAFKQCDQPRIFEMKYSPAHPQDMYSPFCADQPMTTVEQPERMTEPVNEDVDKTVDDGDELMLPCDLKQATPSNPT